MNRKFLQFGSKRIEYVLSYTDRKTLGITVNPDLSVVIHAPLNANQAKIEEKLRKRAPWILKQFDFFLGFFPRSPEKKYVSGESHLYLGRQYRLKVLQSKKTEVHYKGSLIEVGVPDKSKTKTALKKWYRQKAREKFPEIAEPLILRFKKYGVEPKGLYLQEMKKRWGSCTGEGKIILNPILIQAPKPCIEYVILHELCHLVHRNHSQRFFDFQKKEMPDWEKWKGKLEELLA